MYIYIYIYIYLMQHIATHCNILQHTATHCNSDQRRFCGSWHGPYKSKSWGLRLINKELRHTIYRRDNKSPTNSRTKSYLTSEYKRNVSS